MSFSFSTSSKQRLQSCHPDIQKIMEAAIEVAEIDFTVVCGRRGEEAQNRAFKDGFSRAQFGESPHNADLSLAVDIAPYRDGRIQWDNSLLFEQLAGTIKAVNMDLIEQEKVKSVLNWGGDWLGFIDKPHWEIRGWRDLTDDTAT